MKKILSILLLVPLAAFAQKATTTYLRDGQKVSENEAWDSKAITNKKQIKGKTVETAEIWNAKNELKVRYLTESAGDKILLVKTETFYPEFKVYSIGETIYKDGQPASNTEKCLSTDGKVIFAEKECREEGANFDQNRLRDFLRENLGRVFRGEDSRISYKIQAAIKPDYTVDVRFVNGVAINSPEARSLPYIKEVAALLKKMPTDMFKGALPKIAGKDAEYLIKIPIEWQGAE